jgi:hypothetical protein
VLENERKEQLAREVSYPRLGITCFGFMIWSWY